jgi:translation initiation factor IF-3
LDFSNIRVGKDIRVSEVRVIDETGRQVGIVPTFEARRYADSLGLDLVEINPKVRPPICKVMDFGKFKFDSQKNKAGKKR